MSGVVYILRFNVPLGSHKHQAQYYIGWAASEAAFCSRLRRHARGQGASITAAAAAGGWVVVWTQVGGRDLERRMKNYKSTKRLLARLLKLEAQGKSWPVQR